MKLHKIWKSCGPGLVVAATGLGAGDIIAAAVAGADFGTALVWAVLLGAVLKFCLNEGIGRWQLITQTTLLEGWLRHLPILISWYFFFYLLLWSYMVAAALMAATGLAAYALWPIMSVQQWGVVHAFVAFGIVWSGAWRTLETLMKIFIALMFVTVMFCAALLLPEQPQLLGELFNPRIPADSLTSVLGLMGGVGGSVTLLSYGYWIREERWEGAGYLSTVRWDLAIAYGLTALFAMAVMILAAGVKPEVVAGNTMALSVANELVPYTGAAGKWTFLLGFWGAVTSSMIGVWHGVPYLFANFMQQYPLRRLADTEQHSVLQQADSLTGSRHYRYYLVYMCFAPIPLLFMSRPVWIVVLYAVSGAFFMPLLAGVLLYLNSRRKWLGEHANTLAMQFALGATLVFFAWLLIQELIW